MKCDTRKGKSETINVRLPYAEKVRITELAERAGISSSDFVRMSLAYSIDLIARASQLELS